MSGVSSATTLPGSSEPTIQVSDTRDDNARAMYSDFDVWNATKIQAAYRGVLARRFMSVRQKASRRIQGFVRKRRLEIDSRLSAESTHEQYVNEAARRVQTLWRRFSGMRIYRYYRDLIRFREAGDPRSFLRSINPRETELIDAAAGTFVRFRLGGITFPPLIYYKIFTHRTVADVGSFAPRDYAHQYEPANVMVAENNHPKPGEAASWDVDGWYQRVENNGWRPVSERVMLHEDPIAVLTASHKLDFHHLATKRREDKDLVRRRKKRAWMMKLYSEGLKKGGGEDGPNDGVDDDEDDLEDADDLLNWSMGLDYDAYMSEWGTLATSFPSDAFVPTEIYAEYRRLSYASDDALRDTLMDMDTFAPVASTMDPPEPQHFKVPT